MLGGEIPQNDLHEQTFSDVGAGAGQTPLPSSIEMVHQHRH